MRRINTGMLKLDGIRIMWKACSDSLLGPPSEFLIHRSGVMLKNLHFQQVPGAVAVVDLHT